MHKVALTAALASLVTLSSAQAEELHDWTGVYGGLYAGATKSESSWSGVNESGLAPSVANEDIDETLSGSAGDFGGFIGLNFQNDNLVYGIEANFGMFDTDESLRLDGAEGLDITSQTESIGSVRARLGYAMGEMMVYATGGFAMGKSTQTWDDDGSDPDPNDWNMNPVELELTSGWVAGGGVEFAVTENVSMRVEGLYYDFGSKSGETSEIDETDTFEVKQTATSALVGVAYHF